MKSIEGGCHCGAVNYTAEVNPEKIILCHCTDCQQMSGAAARGVAPAQGASFKLNGTVKDYVKQTAESGNPRVQAFCPECGTHLYATSLDGEHDEKIFGLRLGTVKQRDELQPTIEIWCDSAQSWWPEIANTKKVAQQP